MTEAVESAKDFESVAARWLAEIKLAERAFEPWWKKCGTILERFEDKRDSSTEGDIRFNSLWANINILQPAIYASAPKVVAQRRYLDADPVARAASMIIQRCTQTMIDGEGFDSALRQAEFDYLMCGRGQIWIRYNQEQGPDRHFPDEFKEITHEEVRVEYVHYRDFLHTPARVWEEVRWVARRVYMTRAAGVKEFGAKFNDVPLNWKPEGFGEEFKAQEQAFKRAIVWEIWDKTDQRVIWVTPDYEETLREVDDPLGLENFFPCPKPFFGTVTTSSLVPIPDYALYQDQARQLDELTNRVSLVTEAIRVVGVYDASNAALGRIFTESTENKMIPVTNWASFATKQGLQGAVDFLPINDLVEVLAKLMEAKASVKEDMYEITGISDILRGQTEASETATAQALKGRYANLRLGARQAEMARFARDAVRIAAEIVAKHFQPETLLKASDYAQSNDMDPQVLGQAIQLLKNDELRSFRIDIETDSTILADEQQDRQDRIAFLTALGGFIQQAVPAVQSYPDIAPVLTQMMLFGVRGFRVGRDLESTLEQAVDKMQKGALPPPQPEGGQAGPSPADQHATMMGAHADMQNKAAQTQATMMAAHAGAQSSQAQDQAKMITAQAAQANVQSQIQERDARLQMDAEAHARDEQRKDAQLAIAAQAARVNGAVAIAKATQGGAKK